MKTAQRKQTGKLYATVNKTRHDKRGTQKTRSILYKFKRKNENAQQCTMRRNEINFKKTIKTRNAHTRKPEKTVEKRIRLLK